jgi:gliding motility-associated-like protein
VSWLASTESVFASLINNQHQKITYTNKMGSNMKIRILLFLMACLLTFSAQATHIVGGEITMEYLGRNSYKFCLVFYFDQVNGNPAALADDPSVTIHIFRKRDNVFVQSLGLPRTNDQLVNYTNPACGIGDLITRRIEYCQPYTLNPNTYNDPQGYYVVWERCCRNNVIDNIVTPGSAGQAFYMEFPALIQNGRAFINSSPQLFPPLSDYACVGKPFYFDFGGKDPDGDSLVYSLATPINGHSNTQEPRPLAPNPAPYTLVNWRAGYSATNMIQGTPPLRISQKGLITVTPSRAGLYVFSIQCSEYRAGRKIGMVVRDFQMLVVNCRPSSPPTAKLRKIDGTYYNEKDTLLFRASEAKCMDLDITDAEGGRITGKMLPVGTSLVGTLPVNEGVITSAGQILKFKACMPDCPNPQTNVPYAMDIVVYDDDCAVPRMDTVRVYVKIIPEPNTPPVISMDKPYDAVKKTYKFEIDMGQNLNLPIKTTDKELDSLFFRATGQGFSLAALGITLGNVKGVSPLTSNLTWKVACDLLKPEEASRDFTFTLISDDNRKCGLKKSDTTIMIITVKNKQKIDNPPKLSTTLKFDEKTKTYIDTILIGNTSTFDILSTDIDLDSIATLLTGKGFNLSQLGIKFTSVNGKAPITTKITWPTACDLITSDKDTATRTFDFTAVTQDFDLCKKPLKMDSIKIRLVLKRKPNQKPSVLTSLKYDSLKKVYVDTIRVGESISFDITANDLEKDSVYLQLKALGFDYRKLQMKFDSVKGVPTLKRTLTWKTDCSMLTNFDSTRLFQFNFLVNDFISCNRQRYDTAKVRLYLKPLREINQAPKVTTSLSRFDAVNKMYIDTVYIDRKITFDIFSNDADLDTVLLAGFGNKFNFKDLGIEFVSVRNRAPLRTTFSWQTSCKLLDIANKNYQKEFLMKFYTRDYKDCSFTKSDTVQVKLVLIFKPELNRPPLITSNASTANGKTYSREILAGETITFDLFGTDPDFDSLLMTAYGKGFNLKDLGMDFKTASGRSPLQTTFRWPTNCALLNGSANPKDYEVVFVVQDKKLCGLNGYDTIRVNLRLKPIPNPNPPKITADLTYDAVSKTYKKTVFPLENVSFTVTGTDPDGDVIIISANGQGFNLADFNMNFPTVNGKAPQKGVFQWTPDCAMFERRKDYPIRFIVKDVTDCKLDKYDTLNVNLQLSDQGTTAAFVPANVFTPNGDGKNDTFRIPNLPPDNCKDQFIRIEVYNRWGKLVFSSPDRNFQWDGAGYPDGVYFYVIVFKNSQFKGTVSRVGG